MPRLDRGVWCPLLRKHGALFPIARPVGVSVAADYRFDGRLFHLILSGDYTPEDVRASVTEGMADPRFGNDAWFLMDVTRSDSLAGRTPEDIRAMAQFLSARSDRFGRRIGIAAGSPVNFGLMRMAAAYSEWGGMRPGVFHSVDEALQWLAGDAPCRPVE